jgi:hypothetical protein
VCEAECGRCKGYGRQTSGGSGASRRSRDRSSFVFVDVVRDEKLTCLSSNISAFKGFLPNRIPLPALSPYSSIPS